jgi:hypothetical protein
LYIGLTKWRLSKDVIELKTLKYTTIETLLHEALSTYKSSAWVRSMYCILKIWLYDEK